MSRDGPSDVDLLVRAGTDVAAFEQFYRRYVRRISGFAASRCASAEDVADVVAETFFQLLGAVDRYDPERAEPASFLFGIAANVINDLHRRRARHRALVSKLTGSELLSEDDIEQAEAAIDAARNAELVTDAVDEVPPAEQAMLRLVASGRTPGQAASELGITPGAGWTRLSRARHRIKTRLSRAHTGGES